jgi:DNA transformation protein
MKTSSEFAEHCLDLFSGLGGAEARSMFGGHAFFVGPAMLAIGDADEWRLWLKVDDETRPRFEQAGGVAFTYETRGGRRTTMSFVTPPDAAMEDAEAMLPWARLALEAAERAAAKRLPRRSPGRPAPRPSASAAERPPKSRPAPRRRATRR